MPDLGLHRADGFTCRTEREIDRRARDSRDARDLFEAHRLGRRVTKPLRDRVENALPRVVGALGSVFYGALIGNGSSRTGLFVGYLIGAGIMLIGGLVEVFLGVNAAGKSLEQVTQPLSSTDQTTAATQAASAPAA